MKLLLLLAFLSLATEDILYDFNRSSDIRYWRIVDDTVMGGRSNGSFGLSPEGYGIFQGTVSLENYGGFSSVRYSTKEIDVSGKRSILLRVKGDGKTYQIRIKNDRNSYYSYIAAITTSGEWQEIEVPLNSMYPSFRGRRLNMSNFSDTSIEEFAILIGNKKAENFQLMIDSITLR